MADTAPDYGNVKDRIQDPDPAVRRAIAASTGTAPEILYFLINDADAAVRRAVAANPHTPRQADTILAKDTDYGVRCELARKIVGAGLGDDERSELWRMGFTILETLATDSMVRVRKALAEALKGWAAAPRSIVTQLARDPEPEVAGPVIENSPVLTDDDLADIAGADAPDWKVKAASHRATIGPRLSGAIARSDRVAPITDMLNNDQADISEETIEALAIRAEKSRNGASLWFSGPLFPGMRSCLSPVSFPRRSCPFSRGAAVSIRPRRCSSTRSRKPGLTPVQTRLP